MTKRSYRTWVSIGGALAVMAFGSMLVVLGLSGTPTSDQEIASKACADNNGAQRYSKQARHKQTPLYAVLCQDGTLVASTGE